MRTFVAPTLPAELSAHKFGLPERIWTVLAFVMHPRALAFGTCACVSSNRFSHIQIHVQMQVSVRVICLFESQVAASPSFIVGLFH